MTVQVGVLWLDGYQPTPEHACKPRSVEDFSAISKTPRLVFERPFTSTGPGGARDWLAQPFSCCPDPDRTGTGISRHVREVSD